MIDSVQVGASSLVQTLVEGKDSSAQKKISQNVEQTIASFLKRDGHSDYEIIVFCTKLANIFDPGIVASHYVYQRLLFVFLDVVSPEIKSKFLYTPHSPRMH